MAPQGPFRELFIPGGRNSTGAPSTREEVDLRQAEYEAMVLALVARPWDDNTIDVAWININNEADRVATENRLRQYFKVRELKVYHLKDTPYRFDVGVWQRRQLYDVLPNGAGHRPSAAYPITHHLISVPFAEAHKVHIRNLSRFVYSGLDKYVHWHVYEHPGLGMKPMPHPTQNAIAAPLVDLY
ncbi:hypothetical protein VFPBJ_00128 [Purpureocillium lilacinum]|uniref:Uncharacterized protein n=1 Tax=Purpureocillium lilacinum TaxID=33203 RepID=A0A179H8R1_PURLI|nr:hypothetical protein VFPBJ_00128 [Purpureocillium lilacinum]